MTLKEAIIKAIKTQNPTLAGEIAFHLWHKLGMDYMKSYEFVNQVQKIELPDWDELLYRADCGY